MTVNSSPSRRPWGTRRPESGFSLDNPGHAPLNRATPFLDAAQSLEAAWGVWVAMLGSASDIERLAQSRLRELIAFARERSPFYRQLYRALPDEEEALAHLPVVTKRDLMTHFDAAVTNPELTRKSIANFIADPRQVGQPLHGRYAVWTSSGSTGDPGIFVHDGYALAVYQALEFIRFRGLTSPTTLAAACLTGDRYALVAATGGHFAGHATAERLRWLYPWLAEQLRVFSIMQSLGNLTSQLNAYQPTLLATYPTAASLLAEEQQAGRLAIEPREIWTGGERLSDAQRAQLAGVFGCRVRDGYGASEFLSIAWDCGHGALHVNSDWILVEPVDEAYQPVPPGMPSHSMLLTNLANRAQPLIRYDLGDSVTFLDRPCKCGSVFQAMRVEGRCDDIVELRDAAGQSVKLLPLALMTVIEDEAGVYRFQLLQSSPTALVLRLDPERVDAASVERCRHRLAHYLREQGLPNVDLRIEERSLEPHPVSGKLRRIVALSNTAQTQ